MGKRVLILSNHFITIYNFRKELIKELIENGHEVYISTPSDDENFFFSNLGCKIISTPVDRRGINPINDLKLIIDYIRIMKKIKPDIIFSYTIKPNIYGCIASNVMRKKQISNITGTGATFLKKNAVSKITKILYRISIKSSYKVLFQNIGDRDYFVDNMLVKNNYDMLPGSGVNLAQYQVLEFPLDDEVNFIFIGRVMKIKGIDEYLACAKYIKDHHSNTNFYVAGFVEEDRYEAILEEYHKNGIIKYIGYQKDIKQWIKKCHCTVLPSHGGEGVPNVLLESYAMGRVCVASDIYGSKSVIEDGANGYLFESENSAALIDCIEKFLKLSHEKKRKMGLIGRTIIEERFDRQIVIDLYMKEVEKLHIRCEQC